MKLEETVMLKALFKGRKSIDPPLSDVGAKKLIADYINEYRCEAIKLGKPIWDLKPSQLTLGRVILESSLARQLECLIAAMQYPDTDLGKKYDANNLMRQLAKRNLPWQAQHVNAVLEHQIKQDYVGDQGLLRAVVKPLQDAALLEACRTNLMALKLRASQWYDSANKRKYIELIDEILEAGSGGPRPVQIAVDEWGAQAQTHLGALEPDLQIRWLALLGYASKGSGSSPSQKWRDGAGPVLGAFTPEEFLRLTTAWLGFFSRSSNKPPTNVNNPTERGCLLQEENANLLRGLAWLSPRLEDASLAASLADAAIAGYKKIPGVGPRSAKIAGACVYALKAMPGLDAAAQLERVKLGVKQPTYLKLIESALEETATRAGLSREDLEELTVPSFDLVNGVRQVEFGDARAEISVNGLEVSLKWFGADGKERKGVPSDVKTNFKDELKALKKTVDDLERMLIAQRDRLERLPLQRRNRPLDVWTSRYLEHPLLAGMVRHLIWTITDGATITDAIWRETGFVDSSGQAVNVSSSATVTAWHACHCDASEVLGWREYLERLEIKQPFKQAHREVYILTEAERRTRTYSNRFAAHILKQHQFNALCAARGWRNQLRLMVDDTYNPPTLELPQWNLRAEYWVEGTGDNYGTDTNETGTYLYLATDQVRFYPFEAGRNTAHAGGGGYDAGYDWETRTRQTNEPVPLEDIPAVVFSEVLRDVDLFVGVSSVGNDPTWLDGGPQGHREYWQHYSFGELSATAETRKRLLEMLVPRLKIRDRASVVGKFLKVRGEIRTYKIHLGSGNILMEPNDQYLCIVPNASMEGAEVFLPFEGDRVLAVILSKAFMLAEDTKITDVTITRQLR